MQTIRSANFTIFSSDPDSGADYDPGCEINGEIQYQEDSSAIEYGIAWIDPEDNDHDLDLDSDYLIAID